MKSIFLFINITFLFCSIVGAQNITPNAAIKKQDKLLNLSNSVYEVALANEKNPLTALLKAQQHNMNTRPDGKVFVEIQHGWNQEEWGSFDILSIPYFELASAYKSLKDGWIATSDLEKLSADLPANYIVTGANTAYNDHEGITVTNSLDYQNNAALGQGVKIGIIDSQWLSWAAAQSAGTVPASPTAQVDHTGAATWSTGTTAHGTGVTEIIYEFAPSADYYLHKASTTSQIGLAVAQLIATDVDIVVRSATNFNTGWNDDSGTTCDWVADLNNAGILFFHGSGNFNQRHWQGDFKSTDGDDFHEWSNAPDEANSITVLDGVKLSAHLQWPGTLNIANNFDLFLYDNTGTTVLASSTGNSSYESLSWTNNTGADVSVGIVVERVISPFTEFEVFLPKPSGQSLQYSSGSGSTASPANCIDDLSVTLGVVNQNIYNNSNPPLESFCSRGPTNGGRTRPDITAPDNVTLVSYPSGFSGASAGGPNAVGLAAVLWSEHSYLDAEGMLELLYGLADLYNDWGDPGKDNSYGHGGIALPDFTNNSRFIIKGTVNAGVNDRPYSTIEQADAIAPVDQNTFFLGKTFDAPPTSAQLLDKEMIYRSLQDDAVIKSN